MEEQSEVQKKKNERKDGINKETEIQNIKRDIIILKSAAGTEQGHKDMCSFDDKEIKHKRMSI